MRGAPDFVADVRAILAGTVRDQARIEEVARRIADESTSLSRRIARAVRYARAGLRLEALAEAEADPAVHEVAAALLAPEMRRWSDFCAHNQLPVPERVSQPLIDEIDEAIAVTTPLLGKLALMRRLVLADAPAWQRLEVLRRLVRLDPENPAWRQDRDELELVAADELNARIDQDLIVGNVDHAAESLARLEDGNWHHPLVSRLAERSRRRVEAAQAERATVDASALLARIEAEWAAANEPGLGAAMEDWSRLVAFVEGCGGTIPPDMGSRAAAADAWLEEQRWHAQARRASAERVADLDRALSAGQPDPDAVRAALRAAEQGIDGVPEDLRSAAEARIDEAERKSRIGRAARVAAVAAVIGASAWFAVRVVSGIQAERDRQLQAASCARVAAEIVALADSGDLDAAERRLGEALRGAPCASDPAVAEASRSVTAKVAGRKRDFDRAMEEAGDPALATGRSSADRAMRLARGPGERGMVDGWLRAYREASERRRTDFLARAEALAREISAAPTDGNADSVSAAAAFRRSLDALRKEAESGPGISGAGDLLGTCALALDSLDAQLRSARADMGRAAQLDRIGLASDDPARLAEELLRFADDHPAAPQSADFRVAAAGSDRWAALLAWRGLAASPTLGLAQADLDSIGASLAEFRAAHPASPLSRGADSLGELLRPLPDWRRKLLAAIGDDSSRGRFQTYVVRTTAADGTEERLRTAINPASLAPVERPGGRRQVAVRTMDGGIRLVDHPVKYEESGDRRLAGRLRGIAESVHARSDAGDALSALDAIVRDSGAAEESRGDLALVILRALSAEAPEPLAHRCAEAAARIGTRRRPDGSWSALTGPDGRWSEPAVPSDVVDVAAWRAELAGAITAAAAPLEFRFLPAGVLLRSGDADRVASLPGKLPAQEQVWALEPGASSASLPVLAGTCRPDGSIDASGGGTTAALPSGSMLFLRRAVER
jgi:hypothetical protein